MQMHKRRTDDQRPLCGEFPYALKSLTSVPEEVTCPDCLEAIGEANTKQQSGTYTSLPIQPWHFSEVNSLSFLEGCIVKRVCRHRKKDGAQDLDNAIEELKLLKDHLYGH